jgi:uncharacterized protein
MTDAKQWFSSSADAQDYEPFDVGEVHWLRRDGEGGKSAPSGIWRIAPEQLPLGTRYEVPRDETFYVLEGTAEVAVEGGPTLRLAPGVIVSFIEGAKVTWWVREPMKHFFVYG